MKPHINTLGIVLTRTNFQEADRIITLLTPDHGKVRAIAKGVRRTRSKLAGGIELFSVSEISFMQGRGEICTLISTRLKTHYGKITTDIERTMFGYRIIKIVNKATEDGAAGEYFNLLETALSALDDSKTSLDVIDLWFSMRMMAINGHTPNLLTDIAGKKLDQDATYLFEFDDMAFYERRDGPFASSHIKLLRVALSAQEPAKLNQLTNASEFLPETLQLVKTMLSRFIRV